MHDHHIIGVMVSLLASGAVDWHITFSPISFFYSHELIRFLRFISTTRHTILLKSAVTIAIFQLHCIALQEQVTFWLDEYVIGFVLD
jgi:hypothetical protein